MAGSSSRTFACAAAGVVLASAAGEARAQTDYYNTDRGRPVRIEDAYPTERYAFELQLAPVTLERQSGGVYHWGVEPEIAYGLLPRTHLEVGFPLAFRDAEGSDGGAGALAGIAVSLLHNLNVETGSLPALGVVADVLLPVGGAAPERAYPSLTGIATRTHRWARFHVNGQYTFGDAPEPGESGATELSRWLAGVAVDRTFPLRSMLLTAEVYAREPLEEESTEWNAAAGIRYQVSPQFALDAGIGRRLDAAPGWFLTFGSAYAFGIRSLIPVRTGAPAAH
jgi:hypothetical protein